MDKIIIFPTDTVYGIGCSVFDRKSINKIYVIKKRDQSKPLSVLCSSYEQIEEIAIIDNIAKKIIDAFLPGELTIILKAKNNVKIILNQETIGIRIPNSKTALNILNKFGPMATTSVNESGEAPLNSFEEISKKYSNVVDKIYPDEDEKSSNLSSTVIKVIDGKIELIRRGNISFEEILKFNE